MWIEIYRLCSQKLHPRVTPYAGVWIEIKLKSWCESNKLVTPYAGVWIEILPNHQFLQLFCVTPYAGVWIEIQCVQQPLGNDQSLPTRECGLKLLDHYSNITKQCHSLRGSVD